MTPIIVAPTPEPPVKEVLSATLSVSLTAAEKEAVRRRAADLGVSMSSLARRWIREQLYR